MPQIHQPLADTEPDRSRRPGRLTGIGLRGLLSAALVLLLAYAEIFFSLGNYDYLAYAFAGSFLIHIWSVRDPGSWVSAAGTGILYAAFYVLLRKPFLWLDAVGFLGVGSVAVLGLRGLWTAGEHRPEGRTTFQFAVAFPAFLAFSGFALAYTLAVHPKTLDLYLYDFDGRLGFQPSFALGRLLRLSSSLREAAFLAYETLPLWMAYAFLAEKSRERHPRSRLFTAFWTAALAGYLTYNLFPAAGPIHIFGSRFPFSPPVAPAPGPADTTAPRNAMPSVHLTMALLIFWHSRSWRVWERLFAGALLLLTVLATLGFGEHYLIDLVVAVPFAVAVEAFATVDHSQNRLPRRLAIAGGSLMVGGWLWLLRYVPLWHLNRAAAWGAVVATILGALFLENVLRRTSLGNESPIAPAFRVPGR